MERHLAVVFPPSYYNLSGKTSSDAGYESAVKAFEQDYGVPYYKDLDQSIGFTAGFFDANFENLKKSYISFATTRKQLEDEREQQEEEAKKAAEAAAREEAQIRQEAAAREAANQPNPGRGGAVSTSLADAAKTIYGETVGAKKKSRVGMHDTYVSQGGTLGTPDVQRRQLLGM